MPRIITVALVTLALAAAGPACSGPPAPAPVEVEGVGPLARVDAATLTDGALVRVAVAVLGRKHVRADDADALSRIYAAHTEAVTASLNGETPLPVPGPLTYREAVRLIALAVTAPAARQRVWVATEVEMGRRLRELPPAPFPPGRIADIGLRAAARLAATVSTVWDRVVLRHRLADRSVTLAATLLRESSSFVDVAPAAAAAAVADPTGGPGGAHRAPDAASDAGEEPSTRALPAFRVVTDLARAQAAAGGANAIAARDYLAAVAAVDAKLPSDQQLLTATGAPVDPLALPEPRRSAVVGTINDLVNQNGVAASTPGARQAGIVLEDVVVDAITTVRLRGERSYTLGMVDDIS